MINRLVNGLLFAERGKGTLLSATCRTTKIEPISSSGLEFYSRALTTSSSGRNCAPYQLDPPTYSGGTIATFPERSVRLADMKLGR